MNVPELVRLINERDDELGVDKESFYYGGAVPAIHQLFEGKPVKLFDGSILRKFEEIENFAADYDGSRAPVDGWSSSYADGRAIIVARYTGNSDDDEYFKMVAYDDSWDNGRPDMWVLSEGIVKVQKVPVDKYKWEEVE